MFPLLRGHEGLVGYAEAAHLYRGLSTAVCLWWLGIECSECSVAIKIQSSVGKAFSCLKQTRSFSVSVHLLPFQLTFLSHLFACSSP